MARTLKLTLAYDGTTFVGWQRQAEGVSIQGLIEAAFERIEGRPVPVAGAGRTDAGAHAAGQVASVTLTHPIALPELRRALNAMLPPEVRVLTIEDKPSGFHARFDARRKTYRYWIANGEIVSPFLYRYVWHLPARLDVASMAEAARAVEGQHDFAGFQATGSSVVSTIRTVFASSMREAGEGVELPGQAVTGALDGRVRLLVYEITGDGFLRHMVRAIVGTLVEIGSGRREAGLVSEIIRSRDRMQAGPTAPAAGLWLMNVSYDT